MTIIRPTTINARFSQPIGLGGEKLWLCPTLGGDRLDLSGNGSHGTYNGGMGTVADKSNGGIRAYSFDASNDFIDVSKLDLGGLSKFTWSAWIYDDYPYQRPNAHSGLFSHRFASQGFIDEIYFFVLTLSQVYFQINNGADGSEVYASNYRSWIHACIVYDGTQPSSNDRIKYYVNGTLQTYTSTYSVPTSLAATTVTPVTRIGHYASQPPTDSIHYFGGKQDDIRVFKRAISPTEVKHLASKRGVLGSPRQPYDPLKRTVVRVPAAIPAATKVGSFKKPTTIIKPSYQSGYARNASESENPKLWDGLVGAWMPSLGVTGDTLRDVSGNGNHGTLFHPDVPDAWSANEKGISLDFSPANSRIETSRNAGISGSSPRTLVTWFKTIQTNTYVNIAGYGVSTSLNLFDIYTYYNGTYYRAAGHFYGGGNNTESTLPNRSTVDFGKWNQVCLVYDGYNALVYTNGIFSNQKAIGSLSTLDRPLKIGVGNYTPTDLFNGKSSDTSLYNRALSPSEIKQLYVDSLAPFRKKQRVSVAVPAAVAPSATYHPLRSLAHPLEQ